MMYETTSLRSSSLSLSGVNAGIWAEKPASPERPLRIVARRYSGSSGLATPGKCWIGFSLAPIPPSRLAPWQVVHPCWLNTWAPLLGSPGRALGLPEGDGEDVSAKTAVSVQPVRT